MATIAELEAIRARLLAQRERIVQQAGGYANITEGSSALAQIQQINQELADVVAQIDEQMQARPAENQTAVSNPLPPAQDPFASRVNEIGSTQDVNVNDGAAATGPGVGPAPKVANNQANDDNPQTSNVTDLGEIVVGASQLASQTATAKVTPPADAPVFPQPNILDQYANYTYQASVYLLTPDQLNQFQRSQKKTVNGYNLLFQSGGASNNIAGPQGAGNSATGYKTITKDGADIVVPAGNGVPGAGSTDAGRNPYFPYDYYIDSITVENILQGKGTSSAHSSTQLKFTVIEPANITLLDNIYKAVQDLQPQAGNSAGSAVNYAAACYLMIIRFYGYDINGNEVRVSADGQSDSTAIIEKYIPFRIRDIKWEVSSRLVSYEFDCQPIGQNIGAGTRRGTIPADVEISGQTVGELLSGSVDATSRTVGLQTDENQSSAETKRLAGSAGAPPNAAAAQQKTTLRTGLVGAMNAEQQKLLKAGQINVADQYEIVFAKGAEKIRDATLTKPGSTTNKGATDMGPAPQQNPSGLSPDKGAVNLNSRNQGITAGMQILQVIDLAIRNSNYITEQATTVIAEGDDDKSEAGGISTPSTFTWYFPIMSVEQLDYDTKRNDFAYKVKYTIIPYTPQDFQSQYFPIPKFRGVVKSYPFWFTGQNTSVLDYRANFNKLYHQTITGSSIETSALAQSRKNYVQSMRDLPFIQTQARSTESSQGAQGRANELAASAAEYLYNVADNGQGEITIIGDPAWMQQGSVVGDIDPNNVNYSAFAPDGTINFDSSDALFEIVWQRPEDYDQINGLADPYARTASVFGDRQPRQSVIYRATNIVSEFKYGKFQQKITGVLFRYSVPGQQEKNSTSRGNETENIQANKPAAALSSQATPSAKLAPPAAMTVTPTSSGQFNAVSPTPADTVSNLPPAQPVSSNGEDVSQSAAETARLERYAVLAATVSSPQAGARDY